MSLVPDDGGDMDRLHRHRSDWAAALGALGDQTFLRLLGLPETGDSGQAHTVVRSVATTYNLEDLRFDHA